MASTTAAETTKATSVMATGPGVLLKTDIRGRIRTSAERRRAILDEFGHSGMSGAQFAKLVGVKYSTFAQWVQKRRADRGKIKATKAKRRAPLRWLEAVVDPGRSRVVLELHLPGQIQLELSSAAQVPLVAALVQGLQRALGSC